MKTIYSDSHKHHNPTYEFFNGRLMPYFEKPERAQYVLDAVMARRLGPTAQPERFSEDIIVKAHSRRYIDFLQNAHRLWVAQGLEGDALGSAYNILNRRDRVPSDIQGRMGTFTGDGSVPVTATSWQAIQQSAFTALTGARLLAEGQRSAFSLCRPPGHHACRELAGGYCYVNNAAVAALSLRDTGADRVAILDIDYHHGNGTQDIFYDRGDVLFVSVHADPAREYPYFTGFADERGTGAGEGFTLNLPLPLGSDYAAWALAHETALEAIRSFGPDAVIVSLGVDTFVRDPISKFQLQSPDYLEIGKKLSKLGVPTLFVMEGGYAVEEIGLNVANVLEGFEQG